MDLWTEASADIEMELAAEKLTRAKVAIASLWPFLSNAKGPREFEHRLALTADRIAERAGIDLFDPVVASLREDFRVVSAKDAEGEEEASEDSDDGKPDWLKEKIKGKESGLQFFHAGLGRWVAVDDDATAGKGNPYYFTGGPEGGPNTGQTNQFPAHPTGQDPWSPINDMYPMQPTPWAGGVEWNETPMNFDPPGGPNQQRAASRLPFTGADRAEVGATDTCANCRNPMKKIQAEWGKTWTHTGKNGFEADDNCPGVPESVMRTAVQRAATNGVPNPHYFDGGSEGVAGDDDDQFPQDEAAGVDPADDRVNWYQNPMQPLAARWHQAVTETIENHGPDSDKLLGTEFASPQEAERWRKAQAGELPGNRDSTSKVGTLYDPYDPTIRSVALGGGGGADAKGMGNWLKGIGNDVGNVFGLDHMGDAVGNAIAGTPQANQGQSDQASKAQPQAGAAPAQMTNPVDANAGKARMSYRRTALGEQDQQNSPAAGSEGPVGGAPQPPPSMTGGPGSVAQQPLTTAPRQMPGGAGAGAGAEEAMAGQDPEAMKTGRRYHALGDSRDIPTADDPTGLGDEYREKTVEGPLTTRPRQPMEHRNPNTPQGRREPIPTNSSSGAEQREEEDEEDEQQGGQRRAFLIATRAIRELVGAR